MTALLLFGCNVSLIRVLTTNKNILDIRYQSIKRGFTETSLPEQCFYHRDNPILLAHYFLNLADSSI